MNISPHAAVFTSLLLMAGCAEPSRQPAPYPPTGQVISSPKTTAVTGAEADRALEYRVLNVLQNGSLSSVTSGVQASARNGAVTLTGSVPAEMDRQAVDTLVRNTTGVTSVIDRLQVLSSGSTYTAQPGQQYPANAIELDRALADRVKEALRSNPNSGGLAQDINVSAQNGAITLTGTVPNDHQRQMVDNLVRNVSGVSSVFDQLQIAPAPTGRLDQPVYSTGHQGSIAPQGSITPTPTLATGDIFNLHVQGLNDTDRALAQNILQGLRTDTILLALLPTVNINVSGGRVILQGNVQSEQQRQAIASVVQRAAGASNVENQLRVVSQ